MMSHWMVVLFVVLSAINVALFWFWASLINIHVLPESDGEGEWDYVLNSISVQITILEGAIVVVSVFMALLGIVGYRQIKEHAIEAAETAAEFEATNIANERIDRLEEHIKQLIKSEVKKETQTPIGRLKDELEEAERVFRKDDNEQSV